MRRAIITCVLIGIYNVFGLTTSFQQEVVRFERGEHPDKIDDDIENRIEAELSERNPMLAVTILKHSSQGSHRMLELKQGTLRITAYISYLKSVVDAAKELKFLLHMIQMPRFKKLQELGDEGYMLTEHGSLLFRVKTLIVQIDSSDQDVEAQTAVAKRIISSVRVD